MRFLILSDFGTGVCSQEVLSFFLRDSEDRYALICSYKVPRDTSNVKSVQKAWTSISLSIESKRAAWEDPDSC
jgi:hypothetical protein